MRYLALERELPARSRVDPAALLRQEAAAVWQLQKSGVVHAIWFTARRHAVLLLECPSLAEARAHLTRLPLVRAGRSVFTVRELQPYDGYERLFADAPGSGANGRPPAQQAPPRSSSPRHRSSAPPRAGRPRR